MKSPSLFLPVAAFEWRHQLRSPVLWVGFALFFLLTFAATTIDQIQIGSRGNVNINAPYAILQTTGIMSLFSIFIVVALVAGTVLRDDETGFAPILRSTRLTKWPYLGGRFLGSVAAALLVMAAVPLGIAVGSFMPWLDAERLGPLTSLIKERVSPWDRFWKNSPAGLIAKQVADYAIHESDLVVTRAQADAHHQAIRAFRDAIDRLEKRVDQLARR